MVPGPDRRNDHRSTNLAIIGPPFFDVRVETFSFGFGPRLFGFRRGETDFRVLGDPLRRLRQNGRRTGHRRECSTIPRSFLAKPRWQRLIIAFAGPAMNMVLAVSLLAGLYMVKFPKVRTRRRSRDRLRRRIRRPPKRAFGRRPHRANRRREILPGKTSLSRSHHPRQPPRLGRYRGGSEDFWVTIVPSFDPSSGVGTAGWRATGRRAGWRHPAMRPRKPVF